ncbi:hypothetical protein [Nostoc sp.]|uniref:hypothetical protein n=1 Tax=Nostoc sp. TaxID=1180 RepID=UPI002FFB7135
MGITRFQPHSVMHCDRSSPHTKAMSTTGYAYTIFLQKANRIDISAAMGKGAGRLARCPSARHS